MGKEIRRSNVNGGVGPYTMVIRGLNETAAETQTGVPAGEFSVFMRDSTGKRSMPKVVKVVDPSHNTDRRINWDKIPNSSLPAGFEAQYGFGCPVWLDETNVDAIDHAWTVVDNCEIFPLSKLPNNKRSRFHTIYGRLINEAVEEAISVQPTAKNARVLAEWTAVNGNNYPLTLNYYDGDKILNTITLAANDDITVRCPFDMPPFFTGSTGNSSLNENQWTRYIFNEPAATDNALLEVGRRLWWKLVPTFTPGPNDYSARAKWIFYDEESIFDTPPRYNALIIKGMRLQAATQNVEHACIYYGRPFHNSTWRQFYSQVPNPSSYKQSLFPFLTAGDRATIANLTPVGNHATLHEIGSSVYIDVASGYLKVPKPNSTSMYEKTNTGTYVLDIDGHRKWKSTSFTEMMRGKEVRWFLSGNENIGTGAAYGYPSNILPEVCWAAMGHYVFISKLITGVQALRFRANSDYNVYGAGAIQALPCKPMSVMSHVCEPTFPAYTSYFRTISTYQARLTMFFSLIVCEAVHIWTDNYNVNHPANPFNANLRPAQLKNSGIYITNNNPDGTIPEDFSVFEDFSWALREMTYLHTTHDVLNNAQLCLFYEPHNTTFEILAVGKLKGNKLLLCITEPRLDFDETMTVVLKNRQNSYTQTIQISGNSCFLDVFILPTGSTYTPNDIYIEYTDLNGASHRHSGDLRTHIV